MTGEGLFVFSLKTKSVMPFFAIFLAETSSWYYEYIKIMTLGTNYASQGLKLAVSRYPRDTKILFWILTADLLVSRRDTTKCLKSG